MFEMIHRYPSEKNGEVFVWRTFPWERWQLGASGYGQTTRYTNAMWRFVTKDLARLSEQSNKKIESICIGGLGGAGQMPILQKHFPHCRVTVVEHDPVVIEVVEKYHLCPYSDIEIIEGDMFKVLEAKTAQGEKYNLIFIDIFTGEFPSPETTRGESVELVKAALAPGGFVVANVFKNAEYLAPLKAAFAHHKEIVFRANTLGLFWE